MLKKVSVIMPCYNQGEFIIESIESVINQSYENIELVIVDDGSTDESTKKILKSIKSKYEFDIKIIKIENSGVCVARNIGITSSCGEYILPLDGDDKIERTYVEKCVDILDNNQDVGVVYCFAKYFGEKNRLWILKDFSKINMMVDNVVFCTAMFRKSDFDKTNGYNPNMKYGLEDWDFWLSILELDVKFHRINEVLFYYRIKQQSRTTELNEIKDKEILMKKQILKNHTEFYIDNFDLIIKRSKESEKKFFVNIYNKIMRQLLRIKILFTIKKI